MPEATHDLLAGKAPEDFDEPLPLWVAAAYAGVEPALIRQWKRRGHLDAAGLDEFGRPMYRLLDVLRAQAATRRRGRAG